MKDCVFQGLRFTPFQSQTGSFFQLLLMSISSDSSGRNDLFEHKMPYSALPSACLCRLVENRSMNGYGIYIHIHCIYILHELWLGPSQAEVVLAPAHFSKSNAKD